MFNMPKIPGCRVAFHLSSLCATMLAVSDSGRTWVFRNHRGKHSVAPHWSELKGRIDKDGYRTIHAGKSQIRVGRLVLEVFSIMEGWYPGPGFLALHKDDNKANDQLSNLYWGTTKDNAKDAIRNGGQIRGTQCHRCKLTPGQVLEIRDRFARGGITQQALGDEFGVNQRMISAIVLRRNWTHI